ncbi:hypothetical protein DOTSEDRAFT_179062 [Dothistroma septosporum NZE10]|uniref:Uncharacterized protein n=1 Tax=Dothistroma septosporum (strain NZE10 / CBS 128990) TaxID=675120 RepID=N1PCT1_DOTSN|nr:hypothetical protein DOTSEDRAFT_179062 [Dothistroma septosporum NZE10]
MALCFRMQTGKRRKSLHSFVLDDFRPHPSRLDLTDAINHNMAEPNHPARLSPTASHALHTAWTPSTALNNLSRMRLTWSKRATASSTYPQSYEAKPANSPSKPGHDTCCTTCTISRVPTHSHLSDFPRRTAGALLRRASDSAACRLKSSGLGLCQEASAIC